MNTKIIRFDIIGARNLWFFLSSAMIIAGIVSLATRGLNVGIDFTGGRIIQYEADSALTSKSVQHVIDQVNKEDKDFDIEYNPVQIVGSGREFQVRVKDYADKKQAEDLQEALAKLRSALAVEFTKLNPEKLVLKRIDKEITKSDVERLAIKNGLDPTLIELVKVTPVVKTEQDREQRFNAVIKLKGGLSEGEEFKSAARPLFEEFGGHRQFKKEDKIDPIFGRTLIRRALWTMLLAAGLILLYVTFRFEFWFAVAAIIALFHDCAITIGLYSILGLEVDSTTVAVILTVFGYSINDTVVIFDRIRENRKKYKRESLFAVMNYSLWETMTRSINTGFTVLTTLIAIMLYGGATLHDFAAGMFIGIAVGTYSSIFNAAPLAFLFKSRTKEERTAVSAAAEAAPAFAKPAAKAKGKSAPPAPKSAPAEGTPDKDKKKRKSGKSRRR